MNNTHINQCREPLNPARPIDKGNFGTGIMATITTDKYLYHIPLNRQRQKFLNEFDVAFAESTLCDIITKNVKTPITEHLHYSEGIKGWIKKSGQ